MPEPISTTTSLAATAFGIKPMGFLIAAIGSVIAVINSPKMPYVKALAMLLTGFFTAVAIGGPLTQYVAKMMSNVGFNLDGLQYGILFVVALVAAVATPKLLIWIGRVAANPIDALKQARGDGSDQK